MNSQTVINSIASYRSSHSGELPALVVVDENDNTIECIDFATVVERSQEEDLLERKHLEYGVFVVNHDIPDFYKDDFPVLVNKYDKTTIKDYLFHLLEIETRPQ